MRPLRAEGDAAFPWLYSWTFDYALHIVVSRPELHAIRQTLALTQAVGVERPQDANHKDEYDAG
jgi:hypothetical protein